MPVEVVGPRERYAKAALTAPTASGYIHIAAVVDPPRGPIPLAGRSAARDALIARLRPIADELRRALGVDGVSLYRALLVPSAEARPPWAEGEPGAKPRDGSDAASEEPIRGLPFDVAVLITTDTAERLTAVVASEPYRLLVATIAGAAREVHATLARCVRRVADVDQARPGGIFIFNHFTAADPAAALTLWEHIAGWYAAETGLDNSIVLEPLGEAPYAFVNHARWDLSLPVLARRQFAKATFRTYVLANLRANRVIAMPVLYRLA